MKFAFSISHRKDNARLPLAENVLSRNVCVKTTGILNSDKHNSVCLIFGRIFDMFYML